MSCPAPVSASVQRCGLTLGDSFILQSRNLHDGVRGHPHWGFPGQLQRMHINTVITATAVIPAVQSMVRDPAEVGRTRLSDREAPVKRGKGIAGRCRGAGCMRLTAEPADRIMLQRQCAFCTNTATGGATCAAWRLDACSKPRPLTTNPSSSAGQPTPITSGQSAQAARHHLASLSMQMLVEKRELPAARITMTEKSSSAHLCS